MIEFDAVVLAGGSGSRLGGVDKALVQVGGQAMLTRVLTAVVGAQRIVCVGPRRDIDVAVTWCREEPAGGGPVAAVAAAMPFLTAEVVLLVAVDMPFVDLAAVRSLVPAVGDLDGACAVDDVGRAQPLLAAYRRDRLADALGRLGEPGGQRVRDLVAGLRLQRVPVGVAATDCDTAEDLRAARARAMGDRR